MNAPYEPIEPSSLILSMVNKIAGAPISRRRASQLMLLAAAGVFLGPGWKGSSARAQVGTTASSPRSEMGEKPQVLPSELDNIIKVRPSDSKKRNLRVYVHVQSYAEDTNKRTPKDNRPLDIRYLDFKTAAIVFPVLYGTSISETDVDNVKGVVKFDDKIEDTTPEYNDTYPCGTRLGKWTLLDKTDKNKGRQMDLEVEIPMTCNAVAFDEAAARKISWPGKWGKIAQSTFTRQMYIDDKDPAVAALFKTWTGGKDPKQIGPVELAKFLMSKCIEEFQPTGSGENFTRLGTFEGLDLNGSKAVIQNKRGSEHDITCAVCAIFRAAGLPTRTVIAYDISEKRGSNRDAFTNTKSGGALRSYVEFCLYDEKADRELWVPVDVVRQRSKSSRAPDLKRPLQYFGNYDDGDVILPFAFQFHPPTTVVEHGSPAMWGWLTTPRIPDAEQWVRFETVSTPNRGPAGPKPKPVAK